MTLTAGIFLVVLLVALAVFGVYLTRRVQYVLVGQPEARHDRLGTRAWGFVVYVLGQKKLFKEPVGIVHFIIFWGFIVIAFGTLQIIGEGLWEAFSLPAVGAWTGFYLVLDVLMVLVLAAIVVAVVYRYVVRPPRLEASLEAAVILALIFGLVAAALVYSGFAYALDASDKYALSPVTGALAALFGPLDDGATETGMQVFWWVHLVLLLAFLVYIPLSKHLHLIMCPVNEFFRNLKPRGGQVRPLDLEDEDLEEYGVSRIDGFTRWQLLDLYACAECGRCQDHCPAWLTGKPLSPKLLMTKLKDHLNEAGPGLRRAAAGNGGGERRRERRGRRPERGRRRPEHDRRRHRRGRALGLHHLLVLPGAVPGAERARQQGHRHAPQPGARPRRVPAGGAAGLPQRREERQPVGHRRAHARRLGQGPRRPRARSRRARRVPLLGRLRRRLRRPRRQGARRRSSPCSRRPRSASPSSARTRPAAATPCAASATSTSSRCWPRRTSRR